MLNTTTLKIIKETKISFCNIDSLKFLVFRNSNSNTRISINLPLEITVNKRDDFLYFSSSNEKILNIFTNYVKNFQVEFKIPAKKTLILRGLGLKAYSEESDLKLKLGFSHEIKIPILLNNKSTFIFGKKSLSILNYNKIILGNFTEKIYRLKKANSYKARGLYYKEMPPILKVVKKT